MFYLKRVQHKGIRKSRGGTSGSPRDLQGHKTTVRVVGVHRGRTRSTGAQNDREGRRGTSGSQAIYMGTKRP